MLLDKLINNKLICPPKWLPSNTCYLTYMGSIVYGVSNDMSDTDIYGFAIPPKEDVFPHLKGEILGFGYQTQRFNQWQEHHIKFADKSYDFQIYSIVKYFDLCMSCNPNMIDSLFTPMNYVLHINHVGHILKDNRRLFLHKGAWHKFKGYAYSQITKLNHKESEGKRKETVEKYGYDTKYAYHLVRLILEVEQILAEGDLDLQRHREQLKAIRKGAWAVDEIRKWFSDKEIALEKLYHESKLPYKPDEAKIKEILLNCLEAHYGNLSNIINTENRYYEVIKEVQKLVNGI